ncbi:unnamed protein product, partial [Amoebophrya sp. A25]
SAKEWPWSVTLGLWLAGYMHLDGQSVQPLILLPALPVVILESLTKPGSMAATMIALFEIGTDKPYDDVGT